MFKHRSRSRAELIQTKCYILFVGATRYYPSVSILKHKPGKKEREENNSPFVVISTILHRFVIFQPGTK